MQIWEAKDFKRYIVFIAGGALGALVNWALSFVLTSLVGLYYLASYTLAQFVNISVNFTWHRFITFQTNTSAGLRFLRFAFLSVVTVLLSLVLVYVCKEHIMDPLGQWIVYGYQLNYLAAIITVTFVVSLVNYLVSKIWVFKDD